MQSLKASLSVICLGLGIGARVAAAQPQDAPQPDSKPDAAPPATPAAPPAADVSAKAASGDAGTITGTIRSLDLDSPLSGATVTIEGTNTTATTDEAGKFTLNNVPSGRVTLRADFGGFRSVQQTVTVTAGKASDIDVPMSLDQLLTEVVVVVGSRTPRTNVETTAPVDIVTSEEISHVGKTQTGRILSTLAPSYLSNPQTIADGTDHVDPAALRGLGPDQVLVLVNGKRRHKSALLNVNGTFGRGTVGTDLNAIPVDSIKRVEILRDGAASQYGSDAIAGVINIVTKDYTDLLDVTSLAGETGSSDGEQVKTGANYGFKIGKKGFLNITGDFLKKNPTNRAGQYTGLVYRPALTGAAANDPAQVKANADMDNALIASRGLTRDAFKMRIGEAGSEDALGSYNLELPIDENSTFYSFGDLGHRNGDAAGFYRYPNQFNSNVQNPADHTYAFFRDGFLPQIHSNITDLEVTAGIKRKGDWTIDASITHGQNSFNFDIENTVNATLGPLSPTSFNAGTLFAQETLGDLDLLRKIDTGGALHSLAFVAGSEVRSENYKITQGDQASWENGPGNNPAMAAVNVNTFAADPAAASARVPTIPGSQVFPGFQPSNEVDKTRNNVGVYAGLESEIIKGLDVDLGGRYENYSDFGNSWTGKAAARVPLGNMLAVRAAGSTGFRAPSLQQLWFSNTSTLFIQDSMGILQPNQVLTTNNASPITRNAFGIPQLKQETSQNASGGLTFRPFENLSITADAYFIRLKNRITLTNAFQAGTTSQLGRDVAAILTPFAGTNAAQFFANAIDTDTKGLDIVGDYAVDTGAGTLTFGVAANFTTTKVTDVHTPASLKSAFSDVDPTAVANVFFDRLARNRLEDAVPHQKGIASIRYAFSGFTALVRADYYGSVIVKPDLITRPDGTIEDDQQRFGAKTLFDADIGYQFTKNVQFSVGADNIFNTFPDQNTIANNISSGRFTYNRNVTQFGLNGGFYYGKLELTFF